MRVCVPYTIIQPATYCVLRDYRQDNDIQFFHMPSPTSYIEYLNNRWLDGETFINLEHDIVPWPGALEKLWDCPKQWCVYGQGKDDNLLDGCVYLGCAKITAKMMKAIPDVWTEMPEDRRDWSRCDCWLTEYARSKGLEVHQHYPSVTNAKP